MAITSAATTTTYEIVLGAAAVVQPKFECYYRDTGGASPVLVNTNGSANGTTAVTVLAAPASNHTRTLMYFTIINYDASAQTITFRQNVSATLTTFYSQLLQPGETMVYDATDDNWFVISANGYKYQASAQVQGGPYTQTSVFTTPNLTLGIAGFTTISATAYASYLGYFSVPTLIQHCFLDVKTGGTGAQTAEIGLFSSPAAPNGAGQTLTKIVATGTLGALTGTGQIGNSTAFTTIVPANTFLWAVFRPAMATTQPVCYEYGLDNSTGSILALASASALTGVTTVAGALVTDGTNIGPRVYATTF